FAYKRGTGRKRLPLIQATNLVGFEKVRIYETDETRSSRIFAKHLFKHIQKLHEEDGLLPVTELQAYVEYINYKGMQEFHEKLRFYHGPLIEKLIRIAQGEP